MFGCSVVRLRAQAATRGVTLGSELYAIEGKMLGRGTKYPGVDEVVKLMGKKNRPTRLSFKRGAQPKFV